MDAGRRYKPWAMQTEKGDGQVPEPETRRWYKRQAGPDGDL